MKLSTTGSNQENPGGCWVFPQPTPSPLYISLILWRPKVGKYPENPRFSWLLTTGVCSRSSLFFLCLCDYCVLVFAGVIINWTRQEGGPTGMGAKAITGPVYNKGIEKENYSTSRSPENINTTCSNFTTISSAFDHADCRHNQYQLQGHLSQPDHQRHHLK